MNDLYGACDLVCLPSYREGLPLALLEASLCEKPILTTNVPGCNFLIKHLENGYLVPAKSVVALEQAIEYLIDNEDLCRQLGQRARQLALSHFTTDVINKQILDLYQNGPQ